MLCQSYQSSSFIPTTYLTTKFENRISINLEKLTKEKELWSDKISLSPMNGYFHFHFVYKESTGYVSVGIISQQRLIVKGKMKSNGNVKDVVLVKRNDINFEAYGVCDLFPICIGVESFIDCYLSINVMPEVSSRKKVIHRLLSENVEQWISLRGQWNIRYELLQNTRRSLESKHIPFHSRINAFYWFSLIPHGEVLRAGGQKYWSLSFSTNRMVKDIEAYFTDWCIDGKPKNPWIKMEDFKQENGDELWSITFPNYLIETNVLNGRSCKIINGRLEFHFDIKIKFHTPKTMTIKREIGKNIPILSTIPTIMPNIKKEYDEIVKIPKTIGYVSVVKEESDDDDCQIIEVRKNFGNIVLIDDIHMDESEIDSGIGQISENVSSTSSSIIPRNDESCNVDMDLNDGFNNNEMAIDGAPYPEVIMDDFDDDALLDAVNGLNETLNLPDDEFNQAINISMEDGEITD
uniref:Uncharacterized protein n=1 Tax=Panagrolaimus sp. JU765 TaxID=591449 RepID=A0AC34RJ75_9BILA